MNSNVKPLKNNKENNLSLKFQNDKVFDTQKNKDVLFRSLWESKTEDDKSIVLLHFLRRFG